MSQTNAPHSASAPTKALRFGSHVILMSANVSVYAESSYNIPSKKTLPGIVSASAFLMTNGECPRLSRVYHSRIAFMVVLPDTTTWDMPSVSATIS